MAESPKKRVTPDSDAGSTCSRLYSRLVQLGRDGHAAGDAASRQAHLVTVKMSKCKNRQSLALMRRKQRGWNALNLGARAQGTAVEASVWLLSTLYDGRSAPVGALEKFLSDAVRLAEDHEADVMARFHGGLAPTRKSGRKK